MKPSIVNLRTFGAQSIRYSLQKIILFVLATLVICSQSQAGEIKLYAAASLTDALTELSTIYQKTHADVVIKKSFAGSSALAKQIENGAPADIFISADKDWGDYLQKRDLLQVESRKTLLGNALVFIAPSSSNIKIDPTPAFDIGKAIKGRICTGDPTSVPVGKYAKQALTQLNWWDQLAPRLVGAEDVRTALAFVERGECEVGIVYKTDALLSQKIKVISVIPENTHNKIEYPGALIKNASAEAKIFWQFLQGDEAKKIFIRYGFSVIES